MRAISGGEGVDHVVEVGGAGTIDNAIASTRPGGTVSGPSVFTAADCAFYMACLAMLGRQGMMVTSNLNLNFLRRPPEGDLIADARILKLGRTLITGEITVYSDGMEDPVAHATTTYAVPHKGA